MAIMGESIGKQPSRPEKTTAADTSRSPRQRVVSTPTGTRTPVPWLRTKYPRPLDDGGIAANIIIISRGSQSSLLQCPCLAPGKHLLTSFPRWNILEQWKPWDQRMEWEVLFHEEF